MQWFSPRRKGGIWSALNKERIERLIAAGLMTDRGQAAIDAAIGDGSWSQADEVDRLVVPPDLQRGLDSSPRARLAYEALADSSKKQYLWRVVSAKRDKTRSERIQAIVSELSGES
jgi:uncharacterized protein YdeI (YjbR/CyaY-like superfamily)